MLLLSPEQFADYELIDCGDFEKLERFGDYLTIRPEPQAVWAKKLSHRRWEEQAHVRFIQKGSNSGEWKKLKKMPDRWNIQWKMKDGKCKLQFRLALTSFKHVGIFPEQAVNWTYIAESIIRLQQSGDFSKGTEPVKFLNLFAYTGAASLAAKAAGADVVHLDSVRQVVSWARDNMNLSGLDNIRWIIEDALKFVKREARRGNHYHGIILDPPAYGVGANGEKWKLEAQIEEMITNVLKLLDPKRHFLIFNAYSLGFSSLIIENLLKDFAGEHLEAGELFLPSSSGYKLPLGVFGRFRKGL